MCHCDCSRDGAVLELPKDAALVNCSHQLIELFQNDVHVMVMDGPTFVFTRASNDTIARAFFQQTPPLNETVRKAEEAICHTMDSCRPGTKMQSFRVNCHSSRVYVSVLSDTHRLVVVNRGFEDGCIHESPDFEQRFNQICEQLKGAINGLAPPHSAS
jgi:hypothetical protein